MNFDFLNEWLGSDVQYVRWVIAGAVFATVWLVLFTLRALVRNRISKLREKRPLRALLVAERLVGRTRSLFLLSTSAYAGSRVLDLSPAAESWIGKAAVIVFLLQAGIWAVSAVLALIEFKRKEELEGDRGGVAAMDILGFIARVAIWSVVLILILDNLGVDITALIAGLGVGGIAVALAAQNILSDLFASLSIVLDKPFVVGDFLIIGDFLGTVEKVGIKTTRLKSLSGEQLVFSNNDLLSSRIRNYGRMQERRVVFSLGVTYQTRAATLKQIPAIIRDTIESNEGVRFDRAHFQKYGDFALIFEVVYFVLSADYNQYMDIQQRINLSVFERFETEGIEFAYPTQTLYVNKSE